MLLPFLGGLRTGGGLPACGLLGRHGRSRAFFASLLRAGVRPAGDARLRQLVVDAQARARAALSLIHI